MQLKGLDVSAFLRLTQPNDVLDIEIELLKTGGGEITSSFYSLLFFDLMNGNVIGVDDDANGIITGISFVIKRTDDTILTTTDKSKFDWYESNNTFYIEASSSASMNLAEDTLIRKVEIYYTANDTKASSSRDVLVAYSSTPTTSVFASSTPEGKGILIPAGDLSIMGRFIVSISK